MIKFSVNVCYVDAKQLSENIKEIKKVKSNFFSSELAPWK